MDIDTIMKVISNVGFPIAVCVWFAWRDQKFLTKLTDSLSKIVALIETVIEKKV